jgi:hypothetical protein
MRTADEETRNVARDGRAPRDRASRKPLPAVYYDPVHTSKGGWVMAVAYIQEFAIRGGDTSTANYDAVVAGLDLKDTPDGLLIHTAGFDTDAGVFRIFDVWETREQGQRFMDEQLNPVIEPMAAAAGDDFAPPTRDGWYELHDVLKG